MGANNISTANWPKQGSFLGSRVSVCFHYDTSFRFFGTVVRDDIATPHRMIIRLDDGRHVLSTECAYRPIPCIDNVTITHNPNL